MHSGYARNEDMMVGNGNGILISHINSSTLDSLLTNFTLNNTLCAPPIKKISYMSHFCKQNNTSFEFFPNHCLVKDLSKGTPLAQGWSWNNFYEYSSCISSSKLSSQPTTSFVSSSQLWHERLGHLSLPIQRRFTC